LILSCFLKLIQDHKLTSLNAVPPLVLALVKHPVVAKYDLSSVESLGVGAAPLGATLQAEAQAKFPNMKISQGYGMTELPTAVVASNGNSIKSGSVGKLIPNVEAKVVSITDGRLLGHNEDGELWFRCPNMMTGYLDNKEATIDTIDKDGFLHTGDVGHFDEEGYLFIVDRVKELIKYKGFQVAPADLEAILLGHFAVSDAAVVGTPDDGAEGERATAFVVLNPDYQNTTPQDIIHYVSSKVAPYKRLHGGVIFTEYIPKTPTGKILRQELRAQLKSHKFAKL